MRFPIRDPKNYERLRRLPADEAIACYLRGDFTIGEDPALLEAIQRGLSLPMRHERIQDILLACSEEAVRAEECRRRLVSGS
jgi:hypothetical protein